MTNAIQKEKNKIIMILSLNIMFKSSSILEIYQLAKYWMLATYFEILMVLIIPRGAPSPYCRFPFSDNHLLMSIVALPFMYTGPRYGGRGHKWNSTVDVTNGSDQL